MDWRLMGCLLIFASLIACGSCSELRRLDEHQNENEGSQRNSSATFSPTNGEIAAIVSGCCSLFGIIGSILKAKKEPNNICCAILAGFILGFIIIGLVCICKGINGLPSNYNDSDAQLELQIKIKM